MRIQEKAAVVLMALLLTLISPTASAQEKGSSGWQYKLTPYVWAVGLDGDMVVAGQPVDVDIDFDELLDEVEFAGQLHFGARKGDWSFTVDTTIVQIESDQLAGPFTIGPFTAAAEAEVELDYVLLEFLAGYHIAPQWELFGGVRYWSMEVDLEVQGAGALLGQSLKVDEDEDWADLIVGARFFTDISEKWSFVGRADIGGFDIGESADSTWSVAGLFFRDFGHKGNKQFVTGWRILDVDFDEGSGTSQFAFDVEQSGPVFGVNFTW